MIASAFVLALAHSAVSAAETPVDFSREILPILSNKCFICHGPDSRKEDLLRLDSFEGATSDLGGYRAVDPGDLAKSEIIVRSFICASFIGYFRLIFTLTQLASRGGIIPSPVNLRLNE